MAVRGRKWNDDEVWALLAIWADASIQKQLLGTVWNMTVFNKIAHELARKGYQHDAKQCQEKLKQLKKKYKMVFVAAELEWTLTMSSKKVAFHKL